MPPKRKSDAITLPVDESDASLVAYPALKKARKSSKKTEEPSAMNEESSSTRPKTWKDVKLEGEDEGDTPIYDNCNEVRRKINLLRKNPKFVLTHWLREIGGINNNSFGRFMSAKGKDGGAGNGTYYAAYVYFEKVRIFEGKKKTAGRKRNEDEYPNGFSTETPRGMWIIAA